MLTNGVVYTLEGRGSVLFLTVTRTQEWLLFNKTSNEDEECEVDPG